MTPRGKIRDVARLHPPTPAEPRPRAGNRVQRRPPALRGRAVPVPPLRLRRGKPLHPEGRGAVQGVDPAGDAADPRHRLSRGRAGRPCRDSCRAPRLWTYPRETVVAEKLEAMVSRDETNSRVKDLWDVACLARRFAFDGETPRTAIAETFRRRGTSFTGERPVALLPGYYEDTARAALAGVAAADRDGRRRSGRTRGRGRGAAALPGAGLRQSDRREPVRAGLARRRAVAAGDSGSDGGRRR